MGKISSDLETKSHRKEKKEKIWKNSPSMLCC